MLNASTDSSISNKSESVNSENSENKYSSRGMREAFADKTLKSFRITKLNDSIHVQRQALSTIRDLPKLIKSGRIIADNVESKYNASEQNKKFAYIESETTVDGENVIVKLAIKKSPQKNKFWVHSIYTIENASNDTESITNDTVADYRIADVGNIVTQDPSTVNTQNSEVK
jgi:hypothetical protein